MRQTGLMSRFFKFLIGSPTISHQHADKALPQDLRGLGIATTRLDAVDRLAAIGEHPQPHAIAPLPPARLVRVHHRRSRIFAFSSSYKGSSFLLMRSSARHRAERDTDSPASSFSNAAILP